MIGYVNPKILILSLTPSSSTEPVLDTKKLVDLEIPPFNVYEYWSLEETSRTKGRWKEGGGGEWIEVRRRKFRQPENKNKEVTFYVANLPDNASSSFLRRSFQSFGRVSDAYVATKKDKGGNYFGFVRLIGIQDMEGTLNRMQNISISNMKIHVSLAKYDKAHRKLNPQGEKVQPKFWLPKTNDRAHNKIPSFTGNREGMSYKDAVNNQFTRKAITIEGNGPAYMAYCIGRSVLGKANSYKSLCKTWIMLETGGYKDATISYLGLVTFNNSNLASEFVSCKKGLWSEVWGEASVWNGEDTQFERIVRLRITGVPFQLSEDTIMDIVGSSFGQIMWPSSFNREGVDMSEGFSHVLTHSRRRINEEVSLLWKGKDYRIWVSEAEKNWYPTFYGLEVDEEEPEKENMMEEGEIWEDETTIGNRSPAKENETTLHGKCVGVEEPVALNMGVGPEQPLEQETLEEMNDTPEILEK